MSGPAPSSKDAGRPKRERARQAASTADEAAVLDLLHRQVPSSVPVRGPMVSMIMLNRDGEGLLRRCLPALARTAYSDLELIVIDNASSDSSLAVLDAYAPPFPVSIVRSGTNTTFSEGNNLGLRACHGDGVLLINNDIEPIDPTWLGAMVQTMSDPTVAAVGARLVYPRDALGSGRWVHPPLSLQHGGVMFRMTEGIPMPVPAGAGGNPVSQWAAETRESPALTAACLLLRRTDLEELGGLPAGYDYGLEDIDLCLQLRARGRRLVYDGRAALWHHESATRGGGDVEARRARVLANRTLFASRWGPRIYRTVMTSALGGDTTWLVAPISVRITGATSSPMARDTSAAVASLGWSITGLDAEPDVELLLEPLEPAPAPSGDPIRIAVGEGKARSAAVDPWVDGTVVGARDLAADLAAAVTAAVHRPRVGVVTNANLAPRDELIRVILDAGYLVRIRRPESSSSWSAFRDDVSIHVGPLTGVPVRPGQLTVLLGTPDAAPSMYDVVISETPDQFDQLRAAIVPAISSRPLMV